MGLIRHQKLSPDEDSLDLYVEEDLIKKFCQDDSLAKLIISSIYAHEEAHLLQRTKNRIVLFELLEKLTGKKFSNLFKVLIKEYDELSLDEKDSYYYTIKSFKQVMEDEVNILAIAHLKNKGYADEIIKLGFPKELELFYGFLEE